MTDTVDPNRLVLVSVDDHVSEPPDVFERRLPAKYLDAAPKSVRRPDGSDVWIFEGNEIPNIGLNAVVGRPPEEYGMEPTSYDEMRPGCFDVHERIKDMNANGVLGSMCFPSFPQYCGQLFARSGDRDLALALLKAYNDWHIEDWCGAYPGRFIPLALPPIWDPQLMADEVRRVADKGCHAISFSENPSKLGLPSFHSDHWDPFWKACSDAGTVVCMHIGSSSTVPITALDAPPDVMITLTPMNIVACASDLVFSPVLRKFPDLTIALSEGGIGWIPYVLERLDYTYKHHHKWTHQDFGDKLPSELFNKHFVTCFIDDAFGLANHSWLNLDMVTWECDYPHSDSTWPVAPETLARTLGGLTEPDVAKVTHTNAMRIFRYDPFSVIPPEQATVAALRAQAADVDVAPRSIGKRLDDDKTMDDFVNGPDAWAGVAFSASES